MPTDFTGLATPLVADACVRLGEPPRAAPAGVLPVVAGQRAAGRALPVRHHGSVDVFIEAFTHAEPGDVLVIDNGGRRDEACSATSPSWRRRRPVSPASSCGACTGTHRTSWRSASPSSRTDATRRAPSASTRAARTRSARRGAATTS